VACPNCGAIVFGRKLASRCSSDLWMPLGVSLLSLVLMKGAVNNFPRVDEVGHLPAGVSHWKFLRFDMYRVNPPLVRSLVTIGAPTDFDWSLYSEKSGQRPEFSIGGKKLHDEGLVFHERFVVPRILGLTVFVVSVFLLFVLVRTTAGRVPAILAVVLFAFDPNVLANAVAITPDVGALCGGLAIGLIGLRYCKQRSSALSLGIAAGVAALTKLTWVTLVVSLPVSILCCRWSTGSKGLSLSSVFELWLGFILIVNVGYAFEGVLVPLEEYEFCSQSLSGCEVPGVIGNRFAGTIAGRIPIPFPRNYILGMDFLRMEVEQKMWSFLLGEWKYGSWPHYYFMTTLFKTPDTTLLAALIGLGVLVAGVRRRMVQPEVLSMFLFLAIPAGVCFASVSLQGGFNHHHRYVLMIYPCMFALASYVASPTSVRLLRFRLPFLGPNKRSIAVPLAVTLVVLSAASSLQVHPYYTSYFNWFSGGPGNGWRVLGFSNIDWGQDILEVDNWLKAHPDRHPLVMDIDYFNLNGDLFGVPTADPPQLPRGASIDEIRKGIKETQWWIISVKKLYNLPGCEGLEYLQQIQPVERIAYAYHVYRIDPLPSVPMMGETPAFSPLE
jgi:Dolichyl-phosphate-mannose-protein mannosyltransferase